MSDDDLARRAEVLRLVVEAVKPYADEVEQLKRNAERIAIYAKEDRERLAATLREDSQRLATSVRELNERQAEDVAEKVVTRVLRSLGLDPDKPSDFIELMKSVKDVVAAIHSGRKTISVVVITGIVTGSLALFWSAFKASLFKP